LPLHENASYFARRDFLHQIGTLAKSLGFLRQLITIVSAESHHGWSVGRTLPKTKSARSPRQMRAKQGRKLKCPVNIKSFPA
jgi:hypothetical protein